MQWAGLACSPTSSSQKKRDSREERGDLEPKFTKQLRKCLWRAGKVAQLAGCLTRVGGAGVPNPAPHILGMMEQPIIPTLRRWTQEDQEFKVICGYIASLRPA